MSRLQSITRLMEKLISPKYEKLIRKRKVMALSVVQTASRRGEAKPTHMTFKQQWVPAWDLNPYFRGRKLGSARACSKEFQRRGTLSFMRRLTLKKTITTIKILRLGDVCGRSYFFKGWSNRGNLRTRKFYGVHPQKREQRVQAITSALFLDIKSRIINPKSATSGRLPSKSFRTIWDN
jgi:hypothetical protein